MEKALKQLFLQLLWYDQRQSSFLLYKQLIRYALVKYTVLFLFSVIGLIALSIWIIKDHRLYRKNKYESWLYGTNGGVFFFWSIFGTSLLVALIHSFNKLINVLIAPNVYILNHIIK